MKRISSSNFLAEVKSISWLVDIEGRFNSFIWLDRQFKDTLLHLLIEKL